MKKFGEIELYELGNRIQIAGMILQGVGNNLAIMFPDAELEIPTLVQMGDEDWKTLFYQLDTLETKLFPNSPNSKVIVRKSQRNIEQKISWSVFKRDNYTCRYCANDDIALTVDHLVLWEDMGQSMKDNLLSACKKCNNIRGNMKFEDWVKSDYYITKIKNFADFNLAHQYNMQIWELAKKLPLRQSMRNR